MELKERRREKAFRSYKTTWRKHTHRYLLDKPKCPEGVHPESKRSIPLPQECINPPGEKSWGKDNTKCRNSQENPKKML
jgi:hypothetical protein